MHSLLVVSLGIIGLAVLFFIVCLIVAVMGLKPVISSLLETVKRLQKEQVEPLMTQTTKLANTAQTLQQDFTYKKQQLDTVVQAVKGINTELLALSAQSQMETTAVLKKVEQDPARQAQTEEWTAKAMGLLRKNEQSA